MTAVDALAAGATHQAVAVAMDIATPQDMRIGLAVWASEQHHHGLIDDDRHDAVMELVREERG